DGAFTVDGRGVDVRNLRLSTYYTHAGRRELMEGEIAKVEIHGRSIDGDGVDLAVLGGTFRGSLMLRDLHRYTVTGDISGIQAMRTVSIYSSAKLPWDAVVFGKVQAEGSFKDAKALKAGG